MIDLNRYKDFVQGVTSEASNSSVEMSNRIESLENETGTNIALLMTGAIGIASEGGEFAEIIKKCVFRNPMDDETIFIANENLVILCGIGLIPSSSV